MGGWVGGWVACRCRSIDGSFVELLFQASGLPIPKCPAKFSSLATEQPPTRQPARQPTRIVIVQIPKRTTAFH